MPWLREVVGNNQYRYNQRWVETPDGYIWSPLLQPVENHPNEPLTTLPSTGLGSGMWVEVSVPYVDLVLINSEPTAPSVQNAVESGLNYRLYYGQVIWVDQIDVDSNGQTWYRLNERYGYGDIFWAQAGAFRPLTAEEIAPISPDIADKRVDVNLTRQTVSCFEGNNEVFFCRASTGTVGTETPPSNWHRIWRKMISSHMSGGTTGGGWDLAGVGWTTLFIGDGIAFHSTFWHNNYGERMSRGCVNLSQQDARFIFRWTHPVVGYDPGDVTVSGDTGTLIRVLEE
ncbi:MAG: L,D-transpeptidase [Anaerolineae bacterium]|nr:L,D-transpeptidase [Anaerolineae bacterium]